MEALPLLRTLAMSAGRAWESSERDAVEGSGANAAAGFLGGRRARQRVEDRAPRGLAGVELVVGKLARLGPAPRFGGEGFQHTGPATVRLGVAVGMEAGEEVGDGTSAAPLPVCASTDWGSVSGLITHVTNRTDFRPHPQQNHREERLP